MSPPFHLDLDRAPSALWAALFLFTAYLQINDPDPIIWVAAHGLCATVHAARAAGAAPSRTLVALARVLPALLLLVSLRECLLLKPLALSNPLASEGFREALGCAIALSSFSPAAVTVLPVFALALAVWVAGGHTCTPD